MIEGSVDRSGVDGSLDGLHGVRRIRGLHGVGVGKRTEHRIRCPDSGTEKAGLRPAVPPRSAGPWPVSTYVGYRRVEQDQEIVAA